MMTSSMTVFVYVMCPILSVFFFTMPLLQAGNLSFWEISEARLFELP